MAGLPGVGKSTFGKAYAQMSRTEFVELDKYVEKLAGKTVAEIFAQDGEAAFRNLEARCLERLLRRQRCTIALGGGTLVHPESLAFARELGCIVLLKAPVKVIAERVWPQKDVRPMLADCQSIEQLTARLEQLWAERESSYSAADIVLETSYSSVDTLKIELEWLERNVLSETQTSSSDSQAFAWESAHLSRAIPLADPSYRSPREQKSGKEVSDRMERLIKAQRQKDRSDRRDRSEKKEKPKRPQPSAQFAGEQDNAGLRPIVAQGPVPRPSAPQRENTGPRPVAAQGPVSRQDAGPRPHNGPRPQSGPREQNGPRPQSSPREQNGPRPQSGPRPVIDKPVPRQQVAASAEQQTNADSENLSSSTKE